jgi:hypothetical protein
MRAALAWALDQHAATRALELATAMTEYWDRRSVHDGPRWLRDALALPREHVPVRVQAAALGAYARLISLPRTFDEAAVAAHESIELARSIGDLAQCAVSITTLAAGFMLVDRLQDGYRHAAEAERLAREAVLLGEKTDMLNWRGCALADLGEVYLLAGRLEEGRAQLEQAVALYELKGNLVAAAIVHSRLAELGGASPVVTERTK